MCLSCWQWQSILKPFDSFLLGRRVKLPMVIFLIWWNHEFDEAGDNSYVIWCALLRRNRMTYGGTILRTKVRELYVFEPSHRLSVIFAEYMVSLMSSKCDWTCCKIMGPRSSSRSVIFSHRAICPSTQPIHPVFFTNPDSVCWPLRSVEWVSNMIMWSDFQASVLYSNWSGLQTTTYAPLTSSCCSVWGMVGEAWLWRCLVTVAINLVKFWWINVNNP